MAAAVREVTGRMPKLTTTGGTSDARFIKDHCPVVELGLVNATIHQVDERVPVADLETLTRIYERFIALSSRVHSRKRYFVSACCSARCSLTWPHTDAQGIATMTQTHSISAC